MNAVLSGLGTILVECVERQTFLFGAPCDEAPGEAAAGELVDATIRYRGDALAVRLVASPAFALELACGCCGGDAEEVAAAGAADPAAAGRNLGLALDATGEILNIALGNYLFQHESSYDTRDLSTPVARLRPAAEVEAELAGGEPLRLRFEERHLVRLYVLQA